MFRRRTPLPLIRQIAGFLWPRTGWGRASVYFAHRLRRLPGTPYRIAAGFACGAAVSFTPFIGFHFIAAALLSLLLRGSLIASAFGTVVGNPWTFPFIWAWIYTLGHGILGGQDISDLPDRINFYYIFDRPLEILWPMTVGSVPTAIVAWFVFFWPIRAMVAEYRRTRRRRIRRRLRSDRRRAGERDLGAPPVEDQAGS